ncbi:MAG: glycosyltransferase family 2 protein [Patescibacteria group bacterium]
MTKPSVSIIIVHYNSDTFTRECLDSLKALNEKYCQFQIVVVDNHSTEVFAYDEKDLPITILRTEENLGFTGGNNLGIAHAFEHHKSDFILLLNSDTIVSPDFLDILIRYAHTHKKVGVVSPKIYFEKGYEFHKKEYGNQERGKVIWFAGGSIDWKNVYGFHRGVDEVDRGQFNLEEIHRTPSEMPYYGYQTMDFASGCCVLIPSEILKEVGLFDDSYFLYWEDTDLSVRISKAGYTLYFCPEAVIWHKNAGSSGGSGSPLQREYLRKNRLKFALKYAPFRSKLAVLKEYWLPSSS